MCFKQDLDREVDQAAFLFAIANPARFRIVSMLRSGERRVGDIAREARLSSSAASQHLKILKECDWIARRKEATVVYYSLRSNALAGLLNSVDEALSQHGVRLRQGR